MRNLLDIASNLEWLDGGAASALLDRKLSLLSDGVEVLDLSMINPDMEPPRVLLDRLSEACGKTGVHRYAVSRGVRRLRAAFALKYGRCFGVTLDPENEVCITMGAKDALLHTLMCLAERGNALLLGTPYYPAHLSAAKILGLDVNYFHVQQSESAMLEEIALRIAARCPRFLVLNFPNNPTGVSVSPKFYAALYELVRGHDIFVINDFVYGEMHYTNREAPSLLAEPGFREIAVEIYSLSKAYSVPGWRVGAALGNSSVVQHLARLKSHIDYGTFLPIQSAAQAALSHADDLVAPIRRQYKTRAEVLCRALNAIGWDVTAPSAGASVWARLPEPLVSLGSLKAAEFLLEKCGLATIPGILFGPVHDSFVRFALVVGEEKLQLLQDRIAVALGCNTWKPVEFQATP